MEDVQIDLLTVFIAAILNMIIGFFWYSKWIFGPMWMKQVKSSKTKGDDSKWTSQLYAFLVSLVIAYFLAFFEAFLGVTTVTDGMFVGFCLWLGFVATTQIAPVIWNKEPLRYFFLHTGCKLLSFLCMSGVIGA
jgi:hypothetical protein